MKKLAQTKGYVCFSEDFLFPKPSFEQFDVAIIGCISSLRLFTIQPTFLSVVRFSMKMICVKYFPHRTTFNPPLTAVDFDTLRRISSFLTLDSVL